MLKKLFLIALMLLLLQAVPVLAAPPDRILIPRIGLAAPVEAVGWSGGMWDVPARRAAGWFKTSAPAGQPGNTVLTGHSNVHGSVFANLSALRAGDYIELDTEGVRRWYAVSERRVLQEDGQPLEVRRANARWFAPTEDERLTLITCAPGGGRLVVVALPTEQPPQVIKVSVMRSAQPAHRRAPPGRR